MIFSGRKFVEAILHHIRTETLLTNSAKSSSCVLQNNTSVNCKIIKMSSMVTRIVISISYLHGTDDVNTRKHNTFLTALTGRLAK